MGIVCWAAASVYAVAGAVRWTTCNLRKQLLHWKSRFACSLHAMHLAAGLEQNVACFLSGTTFVLVI